MRPALLALLCGCALDHKFDTGESGLVAVPSEDGDGDGYLGPTDCDDDDFAINPSAEELCDGVNNDCDDEIDEDAADGSVWYEDADHDGYGDALLGTLCDEPVDGALVGGDCDDEDSAIFPGAADECGDGVDNDCDGVIACRWEGQRSAGDVDLLIQGEQAGSYFGKHVLMPGDLDGDGLGDLVIAASGTRASAANSGAIYTFLGPITGDLSSSDADASYSEGVSDAYLGYRLSVLGDLTGSGFQEIGVSDYYGTKLSILGEYVAGSSDATSCTLTPETDVWGPGFGTAAAGGIDADGDGLVDLAVSATTDGSTGQGVIYLYSVTGGSETCPELTQEANVEGLETGDQVGTSLAWADLDGDGQTELLIGAGGVDGPYSDGGAVYVLEDPSAETLDDATAVHGTGSNCYLAFSLATLDANGDGYPDMLVGAPGCLFTRDGSDGMAWIAYGWEGALGDEGLARGMEVDGSHSAVLGYSVASGGDMDGDGNDEILVGAPSWQDGSATIEGALLLWYGPAEGTFEDTGSDAIFVGSIGGEKLGWSVAGGSDLSGDSLPDLAVSGDGASGNTGLVRVIPGMNY